MDGRSNRRRPVVGPSLGSPAVRLTYMATGYPYPSHTFIQNEVRALRALGADVRTVTNRRSSPDQILSEADRREAAATYAILPFKATRFVGAHVEAILRTRSRYLKALRTGWSVRAPGAHGALWQLFYFAEAALLWQECRRSGSSHIHAHFANVGSNVALLAAELGGEDWGWSFTMHGPGEFYDVRFFRLDAKVRRARFVACISDFCRSQLMAVSRPEDWDKLEIVHCGIDPDHLTPIEATGRDASPLHVICVGRLVPEKGQRLLLEGAAELRDRGIQLRLTFVGDGPMREALERDALAYGLNGTATFTGALSHPETLELMRTADLLCLASFAEGVPVTLMEAMALGLPVITTRVMGIPELVEHEVGGLLVAPGNQPELVAALERLAHDPTLRAELGANARAKVVNDYNLWTETRELLKLFERHSRGRSLPSVRARTSSGAYPSRRSRTFDSVKKS
jgi:glycosyltransferase involved in cell wall biosynthesis